MGPGTFAGCPTPPATTEGAEGLGAAVGATGSAAEAGCGPGVVEGASLAASAEDEKAGVGSLALRWSSSAAEAATSGIAAASASPVGIVSADVSWLAPAETGEATRGGAAASASGCGAAATAPPI